MQQELLEARQSLADMKRTYDSERESWTNDKRTLEDTIVDLTTSEKSSAEDRTSRETEVRQQEERVKVCIVIL